MRILYHHRTRADGAEGIHIKEMIHAFERLGHQVAQVSIVRARPDASTPSSLVDSHRGLPLPQGLAETGRVLLNLPDYLLMKRAIRHLTPAVIYKRHALFDFGASVAARRSRVPIAVEVNTLYSDPSYQRFEPLAFSRLARRAERAAFRAADLLIAVSSPLAERMRALAGDELPILVLPNGTNPAVFDPAAHNGERIRAALNLTGRFVIGWTGILRAWHGLDMLLQILPRMTDATLLVVGDGPERSRLEQTAGRLGVADRVRFTGRVPHREVPSYIAAMDVAVAADDRTGFASPMKVVEYMALARSVVVPDARNFDDFVRHGDNGMRFRTGDLEDLARQLTTLKTSASLRAALGAAARRDVEQRLNWEANARRVLVALSAQPSRPALSRPNARATLLG